jgi:chemotaxis response regulator CheB
MHIPTTTSFTGARHAAQEKADAAGAPYAIYQHDGAVFVGPLSDQPPNIVEIVEPAPETPSA